MLMRRGGLIVCALASGSSGPGLDHALGHCVVGQDTLLSQCLSPPMCINEVSHDELK